ncbi:MAG: DUF2071 domain-containing protein, partial [Chlorobia bacterium]|nr:DUF2071 domain-containing protein [Fimbriimonadaceae bacterium]
HRGNATHQIEVQVGDALPYPEPGSLEFFLVERYLLYAIKADSLYTGLVHHPPYAIRSAEVQSCGESMVQATGISPRPWEHACYSAGVDVEVFGIEKV